MVTAASRAVCKGALAANCPSAIRDLNSFLCSHGDLINKICKLIIIRKIITCQKELIIWHSKLQACQWITFMTKQIWSSWLPLSRSLHHSVLSSQWPIVYVYFVCCLWICNDNSRPLPNIFACSSEASLIEAFFSTAQKYTACPTIYRLGAYFCAEFGVIWLSFSQISRNFTTYLIQRYQKDHLVL